MHIGIGIGLDKIRRAVAAIFSPLSLFSNSEQGVWYDPSDVDVNWRRNLLTYTEEFDNAVWTKSNVTVTANATTAPDGTLTADKLATIATTTSANYVQTLIAAVDRLSSTYSVYAKAAEVSEFTLFFTVHNTNANFNLTDETATVNGASGVSATIVGVGGGWFRCSVATSANTHQSVRIYASKYGLAYTGDGTSGIYIWGAQLEAGDTATAYQRIVTPEITYVADVQPQPILYQDSAGTTPVTAVEQPVGLMLDKSQELVLGSELVTNGDFSDGTTGWTLSGSADVIDDELVFVGGTVGEAFFSLSEQPAGYYRVKINKTVLGAVGLTSAVIVLRLGTTNVVSYGVGGVDGPKEYDNFIFASSAFDNVAIKYSGASAYEYKFDNISVQELPGNHALQSTAAARPVLSARYNLLSYTEDFSNAYWTKTALTITANATTAPDGTTTADLMLETVADANHCVAKGGIFTGITVEQTGIIRAKPAGRNFLFVEGGFGSIRRGFVVDLTNGDMRTISAGGSSDVVTLTDFSVNEDGWATITYTASCETNRTLRIGCADVLGTSGTTSPSYVGDITKGIYIWGADLRVTNDGVDLPAYQRVDDTGTTGNYDTVGFPVYLSFDGTDDSMVTNSIDFTGTDKMTVWGGLRKLSDAASAIYTELGSSVDSNNGTFAMVAPANSGNLSYRMSSRGNVLAATEGGIFASAPDTSVITGICNISGDIVSLRRNNTVVNTVTSNQGAGNYGNYPLYIGSRAGTSLRFNGRMYSLIVRGAESTATEITDTEDWVNNVTKAY